MILKFRDAQFDSWTYRDGVKQVKTFECRFFPVDTAGDQDGPYKGQYVARVGNKEEGDRVVPLRANIRPTGKPHVDKEEIGGVIAWSEIVDPVRAIVNGPPEHKVLMVDFRKGAEEPTGQQMLIFDRRTRVYLLNDQGDNVEVL